jgi:hypothetical protein
LLIDTALPPLIWRYCLASTFGLAPAFHAPTRAIRTRTQSRASGGGRDDARLDSLIETTKLMKKNYPAVLLAAILAALAGCASSSYRPVPQYAAPEGTPTADLKSAIWGATDRRESIEVFVSACGGAQRTRVFSIHDSKSDPLGSVKVEANQPLRFDYYEAAESSRRLRYGIASGFRF